MKTPFEKITHHDSMLRFGCDKPDMRFGMEITDITAEAGKSEFSVFKNAIAKGGVVRCLCVSSDFSRNKMDELIEFVKKEQGSGNGVGKSAG